MISKHQQISDVQLAWMQRKVSDSVGGGAHQLGFEGSLKTERAWVNGPENVLEFES